MMAKRRKSVEYKVKGLDVISVAVEFTKKQLIPERENSPFRLRS
jgi:hypothetical protein